MRVKIPIKSHLRAVMKNILIILSLLATVACSDKSNDFTQNPVPPIIPNNFELLENSGLIKDFNVSETESGTIEVKVLPTEKIQLPLFIEVLSGNSGNFSIISTTCQDNRLLEIDETCEINYEITKATPGPIEITVAISSSTTTKNLSYTGTVSSDPLAVVDCYGTWSACSQTCGGGTQSFTIINAPANGGLACPSSPRSCNEQTCPIPTHDFQLSANTSLATINVSQTHTGTITVENIDGVINLPLNINLSTPISGELTITGNTCSSGVLNLNDTCLIDYEIKRLSPGPIDITLNVVSSLVSKSLNFTGDVIATPIIPHDFSLNGANTIPAFNEGEERTGSITVSGITGETPLPLLITLDPVSVGAFIINSTTCLSGTLSPSETCLINYTVSRLTPGPIDITVKVEASSLERTFNITSNVISLTPPAHDFSVVGGGNLPDIFTDEVIAGNITIESTLGTVSLPLNITLGVPLNGNLEIVANSCLSGSLELGETCQLFYHFKRDDAGPLNATINISSSQHTKTISINSNAVVRPPQPIDFNLVGVQSIPDMEVSDTYSGEITVEGISGNTALPFIITSGVGNAQVSITNTTCLSGDLAQGDICFINYTLKHFSVGAYTAEIKVKSGSLEKSHLLTGEIIPTAPPVHNFSLSATTNLPTIETDEDHIGSIIITGTEGITPLPLAITTQIGAQGTFGITSNTCQSGSLAVGENCSIGYQISRATPGPIDITVAIESSQHQETINFNGTVIEASGPQPIQDVFILTNLTDLSNPTPINQDLLGTLEVEVGIMTGKLQMPLRVEFSGVGFFTVLNNSCVGPLELDVGEKCYIDYQLNRLSPGNLDINVAVSSNTSTEIVNLNADFISIPISLSYNPSTRNFISDPGAMITMAPTYIGPTVNFFQVSPALTNGLSIHPTTGVISGRPFGTKALTSHTVSVHTDLGSASTIIDISFALPNVILQYSVNEIELMFGDQITYDPLVVGGNPTSFSINPATLPPGITFMTNNGRISGTSTGTFERQTFTITVNTANGSAQYQIAMESQVVPEDVLATVDPIIKHKYMKLTSSEDPSNFKPAYFLSQFSIFEEVEIADPFTLLPDNIVAPDVPGGLDPLVENIITNPTIPTGTHRTLGHVQVVQIPYNDQQVNPLHIRDTGIESFSVCNILDFNDDLVTTCIKGKNSILSTLTRGLDIIKIQIQKAFGGTYTFTRELAIPLEAKMISNLNGFFSDVVSDSVSTNGKVYFVYRDSDALTHFMSFNGNEFREELKIDGEINDARRAILVEDGVIYFSSKNGNQISSWAYFPVEEELIRLSVYTGSSSHVRVKILQKTNDGIIFGLQNDINQRSILFGNLNFFNKTTKELTIISGPSNNPSSLIQSTETSFIEYDLNKVIFKERANPQRLIYLDIDARTMEYINHGSVSQCILMGKISQKLYLACRNPASYIGGGGKNKIYTYDLTTKDFQQYTEIRGPEFNDIAQLNCSNNVNPTPNLILFRGFRNDTDVNPQPRLLKITSTGIQEEKLNVDSSHYYVNINDRFNIVNRFGQCESIIGSNRELMITVIQQENNNSDSSRRLYAYNLDTDELSIRQYRDITWRAYKFPNNKYITYLDESNTLPKTFRGEVDYNNNISYDSGTGISQIIDGDGTFNIQPLYTTGNPIFFADETRGLMLLGGSSQAYTINGLKFALKTQNAIYQIADLQGQISDLDIPSSNNLKVFGFILNNKAYIPIRNQTTNVNKIFEVDFTPILDHEAEVYGD